MTSERDRENDAARVGTALKEERIKNPYRVWKLDPPCQLGKMWHGQKPENT